MTLSHKLYNKHPESQVSKKKIAFIFNHSHFLGGGEISFLELIKRVDYDKFIPLVIVPEEGEITRCIAALGLEVAVCPSRSLKKMVLGSAIFSLLSICRILRSEGIKIIHANGSRACFYSGIAGRLLGIPVIWHVRETIQDIAIYDRLLAHLSTLIICVSKSVQVKRFTKFNRRINNKTYVAYNGVDTLRFTKDLKQGLNIRRNYGLDDHILFGLVGNIIPRKGHDFFLKGLARAKALNSDLMVKALFFGRFIDAEYKNKLSRLIKAKQLTDDVMFMGYSENIPANLSAFDVFVLPSRSEGFSRSLIEAMSIGLPVLASKISEIAEAVIPGRNAILVEYGDVTQMASAITMLAENKQLRKRMGSENRKRALTMFSIQNHTDCIQRIYKNIFYGNRQSN